MLTWAMDMKKKKKSDAHATEGKKASAARRQAREGLYLSRCMYACMMPVSQYSEL
jgi:hypothetical protein